MSTVAAPAAIEVGAGIWAVATTIRIVAVAVIWRWTTVARRHPPCPLTRLPETRRIDKIVTGVATMPKRRDSDPSSSAPPTSLEPGVIMLGMGDPTEMLEKAKTHGLDLLAVFDVMVSVSSRDVPKNSTLVSVYNVKTGEKVASTRRLNHLAYVKALADGRADQIETELDGIFQEATDNTFKASAIPEISAETAAKRVDFLANQDTSNPLPGLAEIRMYLDQNLISEDDFVAAAAELIGPENAALVVDADIQKREQSLRDWLPGQFEIEDNEDTTEFR